MARKGRRRRDNSWFGESRRHSVAARIGHRRGGKRKTRRNRGGGGGSMAIPSITSHPLGAIKSGFKVNRLKQAAWVIGGNLGTTLAADAVISRVDFLKGSGTINQFANILTVGGVAGVLAGLIHSAMPRHSSDVLLGGILAAMTRTLKTVAPAQFGNLSDDLDDYAYPGEPRVALSGGPGYGPYAMSGMNDFVHPSQIQHAFPVGMGGVNDYAGMNQAAAAIRLDGLADQAVAEEIASQS